ncbi:hypothetical protein IHQ56_13305 [Methylobacillus flagellatus]|nr:hypothetical protein [Methylobacillus flagellatus]
MAEVTRLCCSNCKIHALLTGTGVNKIHSLKNPVKTGTFIACSTLQAIYKPAATLYNSLIQAMQAILSQRERCLGNAPQRRHAGNSQYALQPTAITKLMENHANRLS